MLLHMKMALPLSTHAPGLRWVTLVGAEQASFLEMARTCRQGEGPLYTTVLRGPARVAASRSSSAPQVVAGGAQ